jgi:predicted nucleic acid-binding protein
LRALAQQERWPTVWELYAPLFTEVIPVDEAIAHQAILLRTTAAERLPTIDSLIAATARVRGFTLVHRDPHMAAIQDQDLRQQQLPSIT